MATVKFQFEAGMVVRSDVRSIIKKYCFRWNYDLAIEEDAGFFSTTFYCKVKCPDSQSKLAKERINTLLIALKNQLDNGK
jgi:hypothetical protein